MSSNCTKTEIDVLKKDTHIHKYIPNNSHHNGQHKMGQLTLSGLLAFEFPSQLWDVKKTIIKEIVVNNDTIEKKSLG